MFTIFFVFENQIQNVPIHYGFDGKASEYGDKSDLLTMLIVNTALVVFIFILSKNPDKLNYPVELDTNSKTSAFKKMKIFLGVFSVIITSIFFIIFLNTIKVLLEINNIIQNSIILLFILIPLISFIIFRKNS